MSDIEIFKPGDILRLNDHNFWHGKKWANARFKVIKQLKEHGLEGQPIYRIERLDLPSRARQSWGHGWFEEVQE